MTWPLSVCAGPMLSKLPILLGKRLGQLHFLLSLLKKMLVFLPGVNHIVGIITGLLHEAIGLELFHRFRDVVDP